MTAIILLLIFALGAGVFLLYLHSKTLKARHYDVINTAILMVSIPKDVVHKTDDVITNQGKDFKEEMAPAEQLFTSFRTYLNTSFINQLTEDQEVLGFEIVCEHNLISFYITCNKKLVPVIEKQVNAIYPNATVERVAGHNIFSAGRGDFAVATLSLNKKFIFPIRTFRYLEADPLNAITNSMSKMGPESACAIQILIKPISDKWRFASTVASKRILQGKSDFAYGTPGQRILNTAVTSIGQSMQGKTGKDSQQNNPPMRHTPLQEDLMKAFNEKASKPGFKVQIRIIAVAPDSTSAAVIRDSIAASFAQFSAPAWNSFKVKRNADPQRTVTDFILRHFANASMMLLNSEELASIFHLPNRYIDTPNIKWLKSRLLAAPPNLPEQGIIIGESIYRGLVAPIRITEDDRRRHIFMIGKTGVGKTTFFENMIDQDIQAGKGVCFIDPLGDAIESIIQKIPRERAEDVILFDPGDTQFPMGLNLLEWKNPEEKDFLISEWLEIFYKLFDPNKTGIVGPQFEHWGRNAALTVMSLPQGGSLIDIPRLFTDDQFREYAVSYVQDPVVKAFWDQQLAKTADFHKSEMYNYFISKFGRFMTNDLMRNIIGQPKSVFDFREVMDSGKILLINLSKGKVGEMNSNLLGLILVSKIQTAAFSRANIPEDQRKDFYLYVDEFQNFTTDTFATILSEARKYRLNLNITNQYIAQLSEKIRDAVIGNAGSIVVYRVGATDAEFMAKEMPGVTIDDMVNLEKFHMYVKMLIDLTPTRPFSMRGMKSVIPKNKEMGEAIRNLSRHKYAKPKEVVERDFLNKIHVVNDPSLKGGEAIKMA